MMLIAMMAMSFSLLLDGTDEVGVDGEVVGGEVDDLVLGSSPIGRRSTKPWPPTYLRRGLVEQRVAVPAASAKESDLGRLVTLALPAQPTLTPVEVCPGTSRLSRGRDSPCF